jgi:hypothetical protein
MRRGLAHQPAECGAERAEALKSDLEADIGDAHVGASQQLLRALDPPPYQVLVGRLPEGSLEAASEVRGRRIRLARERGDIERSGVLAVDHILRPEEMDVNGDRVRHLLDRLRPPDPDLRRGLPRSWSR